MRQNNTRPIVVKIRRGNWFKFLCETCGDGKERGQIEITTHIRRYHEGFSPQNILRSAKLTQEEKF
jgi:hypothetical protein